MTHGQEVSVVRGNPTSDELAAVVSVLEAMSAEVEGIRAQTAEAPASAWALSQRPIRTPIVAGVTRWRGFS